MKIEMWKLVASILLCQLAGVIGSFFTRPAVSSWYVTLNKPSFNPPDYIFAPVWITLYLLMGISLFLVWRRGITGPSEKKAVMFFTAQLVFNAAWSMIFFGLKAFLLAFVELLGLWLLVMMTVIYFYRISKPAAILLIPYLIWISYAAVLNYSIYSLN